MKKTIAALFLLFMIFAPSAQAKTSKANCALFQDNRVIEQSDCTQTILNTTHGEGEGGNLINYQWETGRVIVTQNVEEFFTINGKNGETVFTKDGYDLCVKNLADQTTFCVRQNKQKTFKTTAISFDAFPSWAASAWCKAFGLSTGDECVSDLKRCARERQFDTTSCPTIGICSYSSKSDLKSRDFCLLYQTVNSRSWHGVFQWKNNNKVRLDEFHNKTLMNNIRVKSRSINSGECYTTLNGKEEFCFSKDQDQPFGTDLADAMGIDGTWMTPETSCTNRLIPVDGSIAIIENNFYGPKPGILIYYDDILGGERMGIEAGRCFIGDVQKTDAHAYSGTYQCAGEGMDESSGVVQIAVKPGHELLFSMDGKKERYVQCDGVSDPAARLEPLKKDQPTNKKSISSGTNQTTSANHEVGGPISGAWVRRTQYGSIVLKQVSGTSFELIKNQSGVSGIEPIKIIQLTGSSVKIMQFGAAPYIAATCDYIIDGKLTMNCEGRSASDYTGTYKR